MKVETIEFGDDRQLTIIDDVVPMRIISDVYYVCCQLPYRISNSSCREVQGIVDQRLKCDIEHNNPAIEHLFNENTESSKEIQKYIPKDKYCFVRAYANLGIHSDVNQIHTDNQSACKTLLYYPNKKWEMGWGGQTVFFDDRGNRQKTVEVVPGRIVIFDGRISHTVMPMNIRSSPSYRFTIAIKFELIEDHKKGRSYDQQIVRES